jgi:hypothetical protein
MKAKTCGIRLVRPLLFTLVLAGIAARGDESGVRVSLQSPRERKPAPEFGLKDSSGKVISVKDYRGKVLVLDFWATW